MMRYLQGLNWTMLALGTTFAVVLAVVGLLLYLNLDTAPEYQPQFDAAMTNALYFTGVMLAAALAAWAVRRRHVLRWPAELLLLAVTTMTILHFLP